MKILIAEDEAVIAISLYRILIELGYETSDPAASAEEAIYEMKHNKPDMAIVDIHLGDYYTGFKVAEELSKQGIPFFFLTALFDQETIDRAKKYAPVAYLVKPFTKENLFATIELLALKNFSRQEINTVKQLVRVYDDKAEHQFDESDFLYAEVKEKYVYIYLLNAKQITLKITLYELLAQLHTQHIIQVHKSFVVNINHASAIKYDEIIVQGNTIPVGRVFKDNIKKLNWIK
jgi:DNA-binding LytR/AlgR family response regulator